MSQHIYTYDPANDQLNEIGGAGHVIKNESGTSFAKRENLQFNGMKVEDDSTNNSTIVSAVETNFVGTYAEWQALTLAERAQYKTVDLKDDFNGAPVDDYPTENSPNPVSSGGVYSQIGNLSNLETAEKSNLVGAINEATASGGGGGSTISVNTTDTELFGKVVTLTDGVTTLTKTFSTLGVALFNNVTMIGTLIISCEDSSVNLNVPYYGKYSAVIEGGFNWHTWVDTARFLDSTDYNSLDEVLADEEAVRELCLEHACVDYLADIATTSADVETIIENDLFAKWVNNSDYSLDILGANTAIKALMDEADKYGYGEWCLMPQVPTMTSNTAPYGECYSTGTTSVTNLFRAFDNDDSAYASNANWNITTPSECGVGYKFTSAVKASFADVFIGIASTVVANTNSKFTIQASDDGSTWTNVSAEYTSSSYITKQRVALYPSKAYLYYQIHFNEQPHVYNSTKYEINTLYTLQFYAWAPKGNVPIMTSDTAPYGEAISTNASSSYPAYKAFDGDESSYAATTSGGTIGYKFTNPTCVKRVLLANHNAERTYIFEASNDNSTYTPLETISMGNAERKTVDIDNDNYYLYYRVRCSGDSAAFKTLQFYGRELSVSVPTMTGSTTPYGEASASSYYDNNNGWAAWRAFSSSNQWGAANIVAVNAESPEAWIQYEFPSKMVIRAIMAKHGASAITSYTISGSDDGVNFTPIKSGTDNILNTLCYINNSTEYKVIRLTLKQRNQTSSAGAFPQLNTLQFYGLDYSEKEFEEGTTKKWLYDHGVELEALTGNLAWSSGTFTKRPSSFLVQNDKGAGAQADLTDYSLAFLRIGKECYNYTSTNLVFIICANASDSSGSLGLLRLPQSDMPRVSALDISADNQTAYVAAYAGANSKFECEEMWLE